MTLRRRFWQHCSKAGNGDGSTASPPSAAPPPCARRPPTPARQTRAVAGTKHPRLQILNIEDLLNGRRIDMPAQQDVRSFKQAPRAKGKRKDEAKLF